MVSLRDAKRRTAVSKLANQQCSTQSLIVICISCKRAVNSATGTSKLGFTLLYIVFQQCRMMCMTWKRHFLQLMQFFIFWWFEQAELRILRNQMFTRSIREAAWPLINHGLMRNSWKSIIGPYFLENDSITVDSYKRMLCYFLFQKLGDYPHSVSFQQHSAQPHIALTVRDYFDRKLGSSRTGRGGLVTLPPRCTDLNPCDFIPCCYIKDRTFNNLFITITEV